MKFEKPVPKTIQKTVRVPVPILDKLEEKTKGEVSVPRAIVQILENWYKKEMAATTS